MKKILMVLLLTSISIGFAWGQIRDIMGNQNVVTGETWMYSLNFSSGLAQETNFIIRTGKYGTFNNSKDTARVEQVKKGSLKHDFFVTWGNTATNDAKIVAYKQGDLPANMKTYKVKITASQTEKPESIYGKVTIMCPDYILFGETVECIASVSGYAAPNVEIDKNLFDIISIKNTSDPKHYIPIHNQIVTIRAKQNIYTSYIIKATAYKSNGYLNKDYYYEGQKIVKIHPKHTVSTTATILCANQNGSYKLEPSASNINWQPISNMTLASGQGTATATFKASGNGYGKIKAIVTYDGKSYTVENSSVWVGKPSVQILPPSSSGWYEQNSSYIFSAKIDGANTSNTVWKVTGDAKPINQYGKIMTGYTGKKEGVFNITCTTSNVCGTTNSITYTGRNNPTSGTGIPGEGIGLD
ncbi:MAG: hypothetical protein LBV71_20380 [Prevotella sp.]|jgi:hypothetical protein|nr:hypothetical protein [Prevotella sp.]